MIENQKQNIGDNSTAIQVKGNLSIGSSYTDIKEIFLDLFELNFPKIQEVAAQTARNRVDNLLEEMRESFQKHKELIDIEKFEEPSVQFEMQAMTVNAAKRGDKSNYKLLSEILCTSISKDCPEIIELISSEALSVVPSLNQSHIDYLSLQILIHEAKMPNNPLNYLNINIKPTLNSISAVKQITISEIQYLSLQRVLEPMGIVHMEIIPALINEYQEIKGKNYESIKNYCRQNNLMNILELIELAETKYVGHFRLTPIGRLIGWMNLAQFSQIEIKELFK